jgi:hypothetical protein
MGSMIHLGIGHLELDWGKNEFFRNHSALFMPGDIADAAYYYADEVVEQKPAYVRPLRSIVRRLDLLGYTVADCVEQCAEALSAVPGYHSPPELTAEQFAQVLQRVRPDSVALRENVDHDLGELASAILADREFTKTVPALAKLGREEAEFFQQLDPYIALRLLAENPENLDLNVVWGFSDVVEGGYVERDKLYEGVSETDRCLVVTEGSSDGSILRAALPVVGSDVADFFDFVDMSEHYPFTGTGNLFRFCQGLARIRIQNRILVVLDNDTAGHDAYKRISSLDLPSRMKVTVLPDLERCRAVRTIGPSGVQREDVNGRAVAIECFLDIWRDDSDEPTFRWTGYNADADAYQGELLDKEARTRAFLKSATKDPAYDYTGLAHIWNHLIAVCTR